MTTHDSTNNDVSPADLECLRLIKSEDFQIALGRAIDLLGEHGDGFGDLGAMTILQDTEGVIAKSAGRTYEDFRRGPDDNKSTGMEP